MEAYLEEEIDQAIDLVAASINKLVNHPNFTKDLAKFAANLKNELVEQGFSEKEALTIVCSSNVLNTAKTGK